VVETLPTTSAKTSSPRQNPQTVIVAGPVHRVAGTVTRSSQGSNPPNVNIPLAQAHSLTKLDGDINMVYVEASRAADVATVSREISTRMSKPTVTDSANLASQVSGHSPPLPIRRAS
jgi:hypothetical protein